MLYRISTEDINAESIESLVSSYFEAFTLLRGNGYWNGIKENSLIIEIDSDKDKRLKIRELAIDIKTANKQQAVLIQEFDTSNELV